MPQLFVLTGTDVGRTFKVGHGATLGRHADCTVTLRDRSVSRRHAHLECDAQGRWWITDAGSRNGVTVRGERVERAELGDGEEFRVGELSLRFRDEAPRSAAAGSTPDELEGEDEIQLEADPGETAWTPRPEEPASAPPAVSGAPGASGPRAARPARPGPAASTRSARDRVLQYHRVENTGGWFGSDLAQLPTGARWTFYVVALVLAAGLFFVAFRGTVFLRGQAAGGESAASEESR